MVNKVNLIDMNFKTMSVEEKRAALVAMDLMLKKLHSSNLMVTDFNVNNIYFEDGIYYFQKIRPITSIVAGNREEAILNNMIWMSIVALWAYNDNSTNILVSPSYVSNHFDRFSFWYPEEDRDYYRSILVDSYRNGKLVSSDIYFSDYVIKQNHSSNKSGTSLAYVKATEAGKAFASIDEAAFSNSFFMVTVVTTLSVLLVGLIFFFYYYFS